MTPSPPFLTQHPARGRWTAALLLAGVTLLAACGGQSSGTAGKGQQPGQNGSGESSFAVSGAYNAEVITGAPLKSEFISFLTTEGLWYALYYLRNGQENVYPDVYTGTATPTSASSARVAFQAAQGVSSKVTTGNATITGGSASNFHLELSGLTMPISNASTVDPNYLATFAEIDGEWDGALKDGWSNAEPAIKLKFSSTGELISSSSYANCSLVLNLSLKSASSRPYYSANLSLEGDGTLCARIKQNKGAPVQMTGVGFIYKSPAVDKTKRLELILTDSSGSGISFRGDK